MSRDWKQPPTGCMFTLPRYRLQSLNIVSALGRSLHPHQADSVVTCSHVNTQKSLQSHFIAQQHDKFKVCHHWIVYCSCLYMRCCPQSARGPVGNCHSNPLIIPSHHCSIVFTCTVSCFCSHFLLYNVPIHYFHLWWHFSSLCITYDKHIQTVCVPQLSHYYNGSSFVCGLTESCSHHTKANIVDTETGFLAIWWHICTTAIIYTQTCCIISNFARNHDKNAKVLSCEWFF